jgi:hypothetical protein
MRIRDIDILFGVLIFVAISIVLIVLSPYFAMLIELLGEFMSVNTQYQAIGILFFIAIIAVVLFFSRRLFLRFLDFLKGIIMEKSKKEAVICWISSPARRKDRLEPTGDLMRILDKFGGSLNMKNIDLIAFPTCEKGIDDWSGKHESEVIFKQQTRKFGKGIIKVMVINSSIIDKSDRASLVKEDKMKDQGEKHE